MATRVVTRHGVQDAVDAVNDIIAPELIDEDASDQRRIDEIMIELDGTPKGGQARRQRNSRCAPFAVA